MSSSGLPQHVKDKIALIHQECMLIPFQWPDCESRLDGIAQFEAFPKDRKEYAKQLKEYFCATYPGVNFCSKYNTPTTTATLPLAPPAAAPQMTPEEERRLQEEQMRQQQQQQQQMPVITTPSGFIGQNPGITIGGAVLLFTAFCCFAALVISLLTAKTQKPAVNRGKGRRPSGNKQRKRSSSSMSRMEKGTKKTGGDGKESKKEERPSKSSLSKSKGKSGKS